MTILFCKGKVNSTLFRENFLMQHGKGNSVGILRLYLAPSALGAAQDDRD